MQSRCKSAIKSWNLTELEPLEGGAVSYVFSALLDAQDVVLKVDPITAVMRTNATPAAMRAWHKVGVAPAVLETADNEFTMLMERVHPGTALIDLSLGRSEELSIIANVARALQSVDIKQLDANVGTIADDHETYGWRESLTPIPTDLAELNDLLNMPATSLIHNDLHRVNVLESPDGWNVIDPKAVLADPHAECFGILELAPHIESLDEILRYADDANLDADLFVRWIRIRAKIRLTQADDGVEGEDSREYWVHHLNRLLNLLS